MPDATAVRNDQLAKISSEIDALAAQISVFKPVLVSINDSAILEPSVYGQLEMIATLSEYINSALGNISDRMKEVAA